MNALLTAFVCVVALLPYGDALAHHSFTADFDADKPVKLSGTVTKVDWANPHTWFFIDVKGADGTTTNWGFELAGPAQLVRIGWRRDTLKVGDAVAVEGRLARDGSNNANAVSIVLVATGQRLFPAASPTP